jgi:hypothetical protein
MFKTLMVRVTRDYTLEGYVYVALDISGEQPTEEEQLRAEALALEEISNTKLSIKDAVSDSDTSSYEGVLE